MKLLIFLLSISVCYPQAIYRMNMNVRTISHGELISCHTEQIYWGMKEDTLCFLIKDRSHCYYPITKKAKINHDRRDKIQTDIILRSRRGDSYFLLQDFRNEVYLVRIIVEGIKVLIFITNTEYGFPSYILGFNCSECN